MPHGMCYLWIRELVALHLSSDLLIGLSYVAISAMLAYLVYQSRRDIPFRLIFLAFGMFIVTCGMTHFMEVWTIWSPMFWLSGYIKLVTAIVSVATAVLLLPKIPQVRALIATAKVAEERKRQLEIVNKELDALRQIERTQAEVALRASQTQLAGIVESAMDAIITVDGNQAIVLFNGAAEKMFRCAAKDVIGQSLNRFIPSRFRDHHPAHIDNFGLTKVTKRTIGNLGTILGLRADGDEFPIEASISQLESENKKFYTVILRDITERKRAEKALKEQARMLDLAPVSIRDLNGRIIFWNTGAEQMYGWTPKEAIEKNTHELLQTEFPKPLHEIKDQLFAQGSWRGELVHTRKDGERIVVMSQWILHRNEQDEPAAILETNNDVTEHRRAEEQVRKLNEELEQRVAERTAQLSAANKELEAFSYSVSHDLRAPLRHINGFSQALLEDYQDKLDEEGRTYLQELRGASEEMARLIDDVLQLARVSRGQLHQEKVNLTELAQEVLDELQRSEPERSISIAIESELVTHGDKRLIRVVLSNLLGNAWKFTSRKEAAEIRFGREQQNGEKVFFVRDNGAGFDMAYADKLFGAFQRLHSAKEFEGTGIGLATVQRILNRHGGRVWVEAKVDQGATFYFTVVASEGK